MGSIWDTVITILATGIVIYGGYLLNDFLQGKRESRRQGLEREHEIREAKRRYRESIVTPIREALTKLHERVRLLSTLDYISKTKEGIWSDPEVKKEIESIKKRTPYLAGTSIGQVLINFIPLSASITSKDVREHIENAFLSSAMGENVRKKLNITNEAMEEIFNSAYKKLEDYVALAD